MMRRHGEQIVRGQHYKTRPGVYAILPLATRILLTHQAAPTPEFQLPGGGIDPGEGPLQALHREVIEETGWRIARPRKLGAYRRFTFLPDYQLWAEKICHIYVAHPVHPHGPPKEDGHSAVQVDAALAQELVASDGDRAFLTQFLQF
ncbi:MAG: NUDIX hydrolase [Pseudomonadota bacterium]